MAKPMSVTWTAYVRTVLSDGILTVVLATPTPTIGISVKRGLKEKGSLRSRLTRTSINITSRWQYIPVCAVRSPNRFSMASEPTYKQ